MSLSPSQNSVFNELSRWSPVLLKVGGVYIPPSCSSPVSPAILLALSVACVLLNMQMDICCCCLWPAFVQSLFCLSMSESIKKNTPTQIISKCFLCLARDPCILSSPQTGELSHLNRESDKTEPKLQLYM